MPVDIARRFSHIVTAWEIVHDAYVRIGLIPPDHRGIYSHSEATPDRALVVLERDERGVAVGTTGAILDGPGGLPLDEEYRGELDALRAAGAVLVEAGTIASVAEGTRIDAAGMIRLVWWWGLHSGGTDLLTSCHPHHSRFYCRRYGLRQMGPERVYRSLGGAPVVMLHATYAEMQAEPARSVQALLADPVPAEFFSGRFGARAA